MNKAIKLFSISILGGIILMVVLKIVMLLTGNTAYILLFNFDYVPLLKDLRPVWFFGYLFHFVTCTVSVFALFYILSATKYQKKIWPYVTVYTLGGGALFFLTALSPQPPAPTDLMAWIFWTLGHGIFGYTIGLSISKWI